ncbi:Holliday junction resolvase RuvX [Patescibacteria group bacterium]|nr:Holliday junction resolvase RuvX [Patescibacteria group bacterium]
MRILGIDLGKKRIGIALGDTENKLVVGLPTLINDHAIIAELEAIISREQIKKLIIGLPRTMSGQVGKQASYTRKWGDMAMRNLQIDIEYVDERLSSKMARDSLAALGKALKKEDIDQAAAVFILQGYFDSLKN